MAKTREHSDQIRRRVVQLNKDGKSYGMIGKLLQLPRSTVATIVTKYLKTGRTTTEKRSGRPSKISASAQRRLVRNVRSNPRVTSNTLANELAESGINVHPRTVQRYLNRNGIYGRKPRHKPLLKPIHKKKRLEFAQKYLKEPDCYFNNILWSDESKIELFASRGPNYVWRKEGEAYDEHFTVPTVKHGGGSIMVWGCFSSAGTGNLHVIEGNMNAESYQHILAQHMIPSAHRLIGRQFVFQQDNDPKHTANKTKDFFKRRKVRVLEWPSQSPDLNPIEMLWTSLKSAVAHRCPRNLQELKTVCAEEWQRINPETCRNLVKGYKKRLEAVIRAKGGHTKY